MAYFDRPETVSQARAFAARALWTRSLRAADAVIAVSAFTAGRVLSQFGLSATVVPEAVDVRFAPPERTAVDEVVARYELPERFVLHVGTIEPRKDVPGLVAACQQARLPLVLAGARWGPAQPLVAQLLGFVPAADLPALYAAATVVAYPSRYEGFGLPPLEAMACGAAVVASKIPPLVEVLGDAAVLILPGDVDALAAALGDVAADEDRRAEMSAAGLRRVQDYSWARTARETAAVYRSLGVSV
jgi:glycosyltransferase involved in cell wall biosynthesis